MRYGLPSGYVLRQDNEHFFDDGQELVYQPHVYETLFFIAKRFGAKNIIDIGCGSGLKLIKASSEFEILGIDLPETIPLFKRNIPSAKCFECDFDETLPVLPMSLLEESVVICSDVIEHCRKPNRLARYLAEISSLVPFILISTPDRDRVRGWLDCGPPNNHCHVLEWNASEFLRFLVSSGFSQEILYGHTVNTDKHMANTTTMVIAGTHVYPSRKVDRRVVAAVIHCYNEADILSEVVLHLVHQGVQVYLYDNWSTDGSWEIALQLLHDGNLFFLGRFPEKPPTIDEYLWESLLRHTEEVSKSIDADWIMHYDADELRYSPWPGVTLADGIAWVDSLGYNAVDFTVIDFCFIEDEPEVVPPYEKTLNFFKFGRRPGHFKQVKAWKKVQGVCLVESGGHDASFVGRRVYPMKFLTKHYPLRSLTQAKKKIFIDRLPRIEREKTKYGWHVQYDNFVDGSSVRGSTREALIPWSDNLFLTEYLTQRLTGLGL